MKQETTLKKEWKKPEVQDLDIKNTASGTSPSTHEDFGPSAWHYIQS